jgi:disulfide bond formation protein DsbB
LNKDAAMSSAIPTDSQREELPNHVVWPSLLMAVVTVAGSLYLSMGMGLKACPLCFYQRTFAMGVVAVLLMGLLSGGHRAILNLLVLPLTVAGLCVAGHHVYLEAAGRLECPKGILGYGTAPQQSLASYILLSAVVLIGIARSGRAGSLHRMVFPTGIVLGIILAWACVASSPPPTIPSKPYDVPFDICRVPYRASPAN